MNRYHIRVSVDDLTKSIGCYSTLFGAKPSGIETDYAHWMLEDPRMNFAISTGRQPIGADNLGFQVDSADEIEGLHSQLTEADAHWLKDSEQACCHADSDKYWVTDPTGIAWETFDTLASMPVHGGDTSVFKHGSSTARHEAKGRQRRGNCVPCPSRTSINCV